LSDVKKTVRLQQNLVSKKLSDVEKNCPLTKNQFSKSCPKLLSIRHLNCYGNIAANVLGLGEVGELEAQMFNYVQMPNRSTNAKFSTSAPILPNPCWR